MPSRPNKTNAAKAGRPAEQPDVPLSPLARRLLLGMSLIALLEVLFSFAPGIWTWGVDYWSEIPVAARLIAFVVLLCAMVPGVAGAIDNALREFLRSRVGLYVGLLAAFVTFLLLRTHGHAYGDGYSFPAYFVGGALPEFTDHHWTMALDLVTHWALYRFIVMPTGGTVELTYAILGALGGVASILAIVKIARFSTSDRVVRALIVAGGLTSGVAVFWFGHMESYTLVGAALLWCLAMSLEAQATQSRIWWAWGIWILAVAFHQLAVAAIPALLYAHWRSRRDEHAPRAVSRVWLLFAVGFFGWMIATFVYRLIGPPIFVPIIPTADSGYSAFSVSHLADMINLVLFIAPLAAVVLIATVGLSRQGGTIKPASPAIFAVGAASLWYFAFWVDPLLGAFRDWDLLAAFGIPLSLLAAMALAMRIPKGHTPRWLWVPVACFGLFHWGGYLATLRTETAAAMRVERLVSQDIHYSADFFNGTRIPPWAAILGRVLERYDLARDQLRRRVEFEPGDGLAWANLGNAYQKLGIYDSGAMAYQQALLHDPNNEKYANNLGILYAMQNKPLEARGPFELAASLSDSSYGSRTMLGLIYLQTGQIEKAKQVLDEAVRLRPDQFGAYYHRGLYYETRFDTVSAIVDYKAAVEHGGSDAEIFKRLVQLLQWSGRTPEAVHYADLWAQAYPQSGEPYFLAGTSLILAQKYDSAGIFMREAYTRMPQSPMVAYYYATTLRENGQPEMARQVANQAIALDSNIAMPWLELVYLAADAGDTARAITATREYLRRSPGDSAMAYLRQFIRR